MSITYHYLANWQIPLYSVYIMAETGADEVLGMLAFLRYKQLKKAIITQEIAQKAKEWAIKTAREIQLKLDILPLLTEEETLNQAFPARASWLCRYCSYSYECLKTRIAVSA